MSARWQGHQEAGTPPRATGGGEPRRARRALWPLLGLLGLLVAAALAARPARAALRLEASGGLVYPDPALAAFRWDTGAQTLAGGGIALERGAHAVGLRLARQGGSQGTGLPGGPPALAISLDSAELALGRRLAAPLGLECWLQGHLGWLWLRYAPDRLRLAGAGASGEDLWVDFSPVDALCGGGGLLLRRELWRELALGLEVDALAFALESARRVGETLLLERERRTNWRLGLRLDWMLGD